MRSMVNRWRDWRQQRLRLREERVLLLLRAVPEITGLEIGRWSGLGVGRPTHVVLSRLKASGEVQSERVDMPLPGLRVYWLTEAGEDRAQLLANHMRSRTAGRT